MAERYDERYRGEPYRGERAYARDERGFDPRLSPDIRRSFDEEEVARRRWRDREYGGPTLLPRRRNGP